MDKMKNKIKMLTIKCLIAKLLEMDSEEKRTLHELNDEIKLIIKVGDNLFADGDKQGAKETDDKAGQLIATQKQILVNNGFINDEINTAIEWLNQDS